MSFRVGGRGLGKRFAIGLVGVALLDVPSLVLIVALGNAFWVEGVSFGTGFQEPWVRVGYVHNAVLPACLLGWRLLLNVLALRPSFQGAGVWAMILYFGWTGGPYGDANLSLGDLHPDLFDCLIWSFWIVTSILVWRLLKVRLSATVSAVTVP